MPKGKKKKQSSIVRKFQLSESCAWLNLGKADHIKYCSTTVLMIHSFFPLSVMQGKLHEDVREQSAPSAPPPQKISSEERKQRWEAGQIDYMGDDSFANIERKLNSFLK